MLTSKEAIKKTCPYKVLHLNCYYDSQITKEMNAANIFFEYANCAGNNCPKWRAEEGVRCGFVTDELADMMEECRKKKGTWCFQCEDKKCPDPLLAAIMQNMADNQTDLIPGCRRYRGYSSCIFCPECFGYCGG